MQNIRQNKTYGHTNNIKIKKSNKFKKMVLKTGCHYFAGRTKFEHFNFYSILSDDFLFIMFCPKI